MNIRHGLAGIGLLMLLTACQTSGLKMPSFLIMGPAFSDYLERGYSMLAEYENYLQEDEATASYFKEKADKAARGEVVEPAELSPELTRNAKEELEQARKSLTRALVNQERGQNAIKLAEAQVNYDCWLMREVKKEDGAQFCREAYYQVIETLDVGAEEPIRVFSVYFDVGKATPNAEALSLIKQAAYAHALHEDWPVFLNGYSDPAGDRQANRILSMRRALAVRNALAQYGVSPDQVSIDAFGEEEGKGAEEARRVDILIEPASENPKAGSSHIEEIAPHYFD